MKPGQIFIQRVLSRSAYKLFAPLPLIEEVKRVNRILLKEATAIWEDEYHKPCEDIEEAQVKLYDHLEKQKVLKFTIPLASSTWEFSAKCYKFIVDNNYTMAQNIKDELTEEHITDFDQAIIDPNHKFWVDPYYMLDEFLLCHMEEVFEGYDFVLDNGYWKFMEVQNG